MGMQADIAIGFLAKGGNAKAALERLMFVIYAV